MLGHRKSGDSNGSTSHVLEGLRLLAIAWLVGKVVISTQITLEVHRSCQSLAPLARTWSCDIM